jgi:hypothetical protein
MKIRQFYIIMLISILCCGNVFNGFAQSFKYVKYPYAMSSGLNEIYISSITFSSHETRIDFITNYTGEYVYEKWEEDAIAEMQAIYRFEYTEDELTAYAKDLLNLVYELLDWADYN